MKKTIAIAIFATLAIFYSCKKPDSNSNLTANLNLLQHKWTIDSLVFYSNPNFTGPSFKEDNYSGYTEFRTDGKSYSFSTTTSNGFSESSYDTAAYTLKDNNTLIMYEIHHGIQATNGDTALLNTLTETKLVGSHITNDGTGFYGRAYFHR